MAYNFWNLIAKRYARQPIADEDAYRKKLEMTRAFFSPKSHVLEFGCGTGTTAVHHAPHVAHITAIDSSPAMLDICRERAQAAGVTNIDFKQLAVEHFDAPAQSFDVVMAMSILHLLDSKELVLQKVHHWLKPGGVLVSSTICMERPAWYLRGILRMLGGLRILPRVRLFPREHLRGCIRDAGFKIIEDWQPNERGAVFIVARKV